jgi:hypothetical protein
MRINAEVLVLEVGVGVMLIAVIQMELTTRSSLHVSAAPMSED